MSKVGFFCEIKEKGLAGGEVYVGEVVRDYCAWGVAAVGLAEGSWRRRLRLAA
ncbi:hypothetical protein V6Z11_D01G040400 [Gossypium hirsutum]